MTKECVNYYHSNFPICDNTFFNHKYLAMAKCMCVMVIITHLLSNISWAISNLEMITDFSNKVLKNSWKEVMFIYM